jgi:hypothetical protein
VSLVRAAAVKRQATAEPTKNTIAHGLRERGRGETERPAPKATILARKLRDPSGGLGRRMDRAASRVRLFPTARKISPWVAKRLRRSEDFRQEHGLAETGARGERGGQRMAAARGSRRRVRQGGGSGLRVRRPALAGRRRPGCEGLLPPQPVNPGLIPPQLVRPQRAFDVAAAAAAKRVQHPSDHRGASVPFRRYESVRAREPRIDVSAWMFSIL